MNRWTCWKRERNRLVFLDLNVTDVEPGLFDATLKLSIDGAPVQRSLTLVRGNGPLESLAPVPAVIVPKVPCHVASGHPCYRS